ncbi:MAG: DHH family phosphoesterase, partial [Desulfovibrionaceae bacterium]|nr:DHH family phosphoesterase [Desulfovibrionaceae bacterium]
MPQTEHIPARFQEGAVRMACALREMDKAVIAAHVNLDGDALGSMGAVAWMLRALGRECVLYSATACPAGLSFCPLPVSLHDNLSRLPFVPRTAVLLDCSEARRLGDELAQKLPDLKSINMDHHLGSEGMGSQAN